MSKLKHIIPIVILALFGGLFYVYYLAPKLKASENLKQACLNYTPIRTELYEPRRNDNEEIVESFCSCIGYKAFPLAGPGRMNNIARVMANPNSASQMSPAVEGDIDKAQDTCTEYARRAGR